VDGVNGPFSEAFQGSATFLLVARPVREASLVPGIDKEKMA
jgi:hypothetical protein